MSFKKPHRRRRGARKSERKNKSQQILTNTQHCESSNDLQTPVKVDQTDQDSHQWEYVPTEIEVDPESGWETLKVKKNKNKPGSYTHTPKESRDSTPVQSSRVVVSEQAHSAEEAEPADSESAESAQPVTQLEVAPADEEINSSPASRKSTLKRPKKKSSFIQIWRFVIPSILTMNS